VIKHLSTPAEKEEMPFGPLNSFTTMERSLSTWLKEKNVWEMTPSSTLPAKYLGPMTRAGSTYEVCVVISTVRKEIAIAALSLIACFLRISFLMNAARFRPITGSFARRFLSNPTLEWHPLPCAATPHGSVRGTEQTKRL
jgi:hypothetical protein